jgi:RND superfamily putative drug exporter
MATKLDVRDGSRRGPQTASRRPRRWLWPLGVIALFLIVGAPIMSAGANLDSIQRNDAEVYLPSNSETTHTIEANKNFAPIDSTTVVLVYTRPDGRQLTTADRNTLAVVTIQLIGIDSENLAAPPAGPIISDHDGKAADIVIQFIGIDDKTIGNDVAFVRSTATDVPGYNKYVAGPGAANTDLLAVYSRINVVLLLVTGIAILIILILVYRSPILPFVVLAVASIALELANGAAYLLGSAHVIPISGEVQGILDVLVLGAGTDYALLLASRFREELRRQEDKYVAMRAALRAAAAPMAASAGTVILGLLCLIVSDLPATRGLGPVAAFGIFFALVSMLILLPCALLLLGRAAFWPFRPEYKSKASARKSGGIWSTVAALVGNRPRQVWIGTTLVLAALALGMLQLHASGVVRTGEFRIPAASVEAQKQLDEHFAEDSDGPVQIIMNADKLAQVTAAVEKVPGVIEIKPYVDPLKQYDYQTKGKPKPGPAAVNGLSLLKVTIGATADSDAAIQIVKKLRIAVHAVPGANALVGGETASDIDGQDAAGSDRRVVLPLVLIVVFAVLALLLRAIVAPLLLIATVVLSFLATMGVCGLVFTNLFHFPGAETSFPMFAFIFLVALGVDYNIFLMTRAKEETVRKGHRAGTLSALVLTGGVITSAGVVLAATFASLSVIPLVYLGELSFAVAFGVLLDTFIVRSLLVPALALDVGRVIWWPGSLARDAKP